MLFWRSSDICVLRSLSCDVVGVTSDVGKGDRCVADINKCRQAHLSRHVDPFLHLSSYEEGQPYLFTSVRMRRAFAIQPKFSGLVLSETQIVVRSVVESSVRLSDWDISCHQMSCLRFPHDWVDTRSNSPATSKHHLLELWCELVILNVVFSFC